MVASAQARGVPIVSARQMLMWLDGRNNRRSAHGPGREQDPDVHLTVGTGAKGLQVMVPTTAVGVLASITRNGTPIAYTTQTIKGIAYAFFPAGSGAYQPRYQ